MQARYGAVFARPGTPVVELDEFRGKRLLVAGNSLVMVCLVKFTERWQVFVMMELVRVITRIVHKSYLVSRQRRGRVLISNGGTSWKAYSATRIE